jgi:PadR family transcriptional regulator PadR
MWQSQLRKGSLSLAVLAILSEGPLYSGEIRARLDERAGILVAEGVLYPILRRLAKECLVESQWIEPAVGHPRRYFRLTPEGREHAIELSRLWGEFARAMNRVLSASQHSLAGGLDVC